MKLVVLSENENLYSTKRLVEAGKQRGWEVEVVNFSKCSTTIEKNQPKIYYHGHQIVDVDAVIPRIGASKTFFGTAIVRQFEMMGAYAVNGSLAITRSRDKLRSLQILSKHNVDMPKTIFASNVSDVSDVIAQIGGTPLIVKVLEGTQGKGVVLVETKKAAKSVLEAFYGLNVNFLVQEFIAEASGADIRAFVVGDEVVASMKRQGQENDFRSNLHSGGEAKAYKLTKAEKKLALSAVKAMGLVVAGVDMLQSNRGPLIMEVNSSPGLEGIEKATKIDVAGKIMDFVEENTKKKRKKDSIGA